MHPLSRGIAFVILIALALFNACGKKDYSSQIKSIDSLTAELREAKQEFEKLDSNKIADYYFDVMANTKVLEENLADSILQKDSMMISSYKEFKKLFVSYLEKKNDILNELKFSEKQLQSLRTDLENNAIPNDSALLYFDSEIKTINNTLSSVKEFTNILNEYLPKFENYNSDISALIQTIKPDSLRLTDTR